MAGVLRWTELSRGEINEPRLDSPDAYGFPFEIVGAAGQSVPTR